jgi:hypothetical protein
MNQDQGQYASLLECARHLSQHGQAVAETRAGEWWVKDLTIDPSETFFSGTIGLSQTQTTLRHAEDQPSWVKAQTHTEVGARGGQVAPFAIDLRDERRWVAFAAAGHAPSTVAYTLAVAVSRALQDLPVRTPAWDFDLVYSKSSVTEWVREHNDVREFVRIVKRPNPVRNVNDEVAELNAINAGRKAEHFVAARQRNLRLLDLDGNLRPEFEGLLEGSESGYVEIRLESRGRKGTAAYRYRQEEYADHAFIEPFGDDLQGGMAAVVDALREYSDRRAA